MTKLLKAETVTREPVYTVALEMSAEELQRLWHVLNVPARQTLEDYLDQTVWGHVSDGHSADLSTSLWVSVNDAVKQLGLDDDSLFVSRRADEDLHQAIKRRT